MSQYVVVTQDGKRFGPTDFQTLTHWAREGRVVPAMVVEDLLSGQTMTAAGVPGLFNDELEEADESSQFDFVASRQARLSITFGVVGMVAWCIPLIGYPVGLLSVAFGLRALQSQSTRTRAFIGLTLGTTCVLLSTLSLIFAKLVLDLLPK